MLQDLEPPCRVYGYSIALSVAWNVYHFDAVRYKDPGRFAPLQKGKQSMMTDAKLWSGLASPSLFTSLTSCHLQGALVQQVCVMFLITSPFHAHLSTDVQFQCSQVSDLIVTVAPFKTFLTLIAPPTSLKCVFHCIVKIYKIWNCSVIRLLGHCLKWGVNWQKHI